MAPLIIRTSPPNRGGGEIAIGNRFRFFCNIAQLLGPFSKYLFKLLYSALNLGPFVAGIRLTGGNHATFYAIQGNTSRLFSEVVIFIFSFALSFLNHGQTNSICNFTIKRWTVDAASKIWRVHQSNPHNHHSILGLFPHFHSTSRTYHVWDANLVKNVTSLCCRIWMVWIILFCRCIRVCIRNW